MDAYNNEEEQPQMMMTDMDSFIELELYQETPFVSGQPLYGTIHIYAKENIQDVKNV